MRAFIDTSSLLKKYIEENGSKKLEELLGSVSEIIIAPITILEVNSILERRLKEKSINSLDAKWIEKEFLRDYDYFGIIEFNDNLVRECIRVVRRYQLKVLDGIQLSSAIFSRPQLLSFRICAFLKPQKKKCHWLNSLGDFNADAHGSCADADVHAHARGYAASKIHGPTKFPRACRFG